MRKYLIIISIISLFLIAGCEDGDDISTGDSPYIGGNKGLDAYFEPFGIEDDGIYTIYDDETFPIQVLIKNKGEEDIKVDDVKVKIKGIYTGDFSGIATQELTNDEKIEGISDINKEGDELIVDFGSDVEYLPDIKGEFVPLEIMAEYIYQYKTTVSIPKVCFVEDPRDDEVCNIDENKDVHSSAAPIQVTSVEEQPAGSGKISLTFEVENVGGGTSTIPGQEFNSRYDQIQYTLVPESEANKWKCRAAGREDQARFADDKATIVCQLLDPLEDGAEYTKEIVLEIEYDYRDTIQDSLRIKNSE